MKDYYIENGLYVFTAAFHKKRGYCCGSGCRHCPYDKKTGKLLIVERKRNPDCLGSNQKLIIDNEKNNTDEK